MLSTTELIDAEYKTHTAGPELPTKLYSHCAVSIDQNLVMIVGGFEGITIWEAVPSKKSYFYNFLINQWTPGPDLKAERGDLACDVIKIGTDSHVIVTGGTTGDFSLKSTEIFSMKSQHWNYGPAGFTSSHCCTFYGYFS